MHWVQDCEKVGQGYKKSNIVQTFLLLPLKPLKMNVITCIYYILICVMNKKKFSRPFKVSGIILFQWTIAEFKEFQPQLKF